MELYMEQVYHIEDSKGVAVDVCCCGVGRPKRSFSNWRRARWRHRLDGEAVEPIRLGGGPASLADERPSVSSGMARQAIVRPSCSGMPRPHGPGRSTAVSSVCRPGPVGSRP